MEALAKSDQGGNRNAFALATLKHSGEIQETVLPWSDTLNDTQDTPYWQHLQTVANTLRDGHFSNKFVFNLSIELYQLVGTQLTQLDGVAPEAIYVEIKRLLKRAQSTNLPDGELEKVWEALKALYDSSERQATQSVRNFIHGLHIADFISRQP